MIARVLGKRLTTHSPHSSLTRVSRFSSTLDIHDASILSSPNDYLTTILTQIAHSKQNITLSALYFGTGELERRIIDGLEQALLREPHLTVTIVLDYSRARRGLKISSVTFLEPLIRKFHDKDDQSRVKLLLYRMPHSYSYLSTWCNSSFVLSLWPGVDRIYGQLAEVLGVYHCKFCLFDDNVLLTGANLSDEYLQNRQDRYILIQNDNDGTRLKKNPLAAFFRSFVAIIEPYCCSVVYESTALQSLEKKNEKDMVKLTINDAIHGQQLHALKTALHRLIADTIITSTATTTTTNIPSISTTNPPSSSQHVVKMRPLIQHATCGVLQESYLLPRVIASLLQVPSLPSELDEMMNRMWRETFVSSTGHSDIRFDSTPAVSTSSSSFSSSLLWQKVVVASPYPSFMPSFMKSFLPIPNTPSITTHPRITLIVPDPRAHGFHGDNNGLKSLIPRMHLQALRQALRDAQLSLIEKTSKDKENYGKNDDDVIDVGEYYRAGWTFHAKGIWLFASSTAALASPSSATATTTRSPFTDNTTTPLSVDSIDDTSTFTSSIETPTSNLAVTYIGSSNFGERSWYRDFELGFVLTTQNQRLVQQLQHECSELERHTTLSPMSCSHDQIGFPGEEKYINGLPNKPNDPWYLPWLTNTLRTFL